MAKTPTKPAKAAKAKTPAPAAASRPAGPRVPIAARIPHLILQGVDRRADKEGISRNEGLILAAAAWGDFPGGVPSVEKERPSVGAKVKTSAPEPEKPGARLDKKAIGKRTGPPISKKAGKPAPAPVDEEAV